MYERAECYPYAGFFLWLPLPGLDDLPETVGVLLDPEDDWQGGVVLYAGRDARLPKHLLRQVHDLLGGACGGWIGNRFFVRRRREMR